MLREVIEIFDFLDDPKSGVDGLIDILGEGDHQITRDPFRNEKGSTEFVKILFPGTRGKSKGGDAPTLGLIGSYGGLRIPGERNALVSDADGCIVALSVALRQSRLIRRQQPLVGDLLVSTHICQEAHPIPHDPYPFVMSPLPSSEKHPRMVDERMDAIIVPETCKGNKLVTADAFAITPPIREGYIMRPHQSMMHLMEMVTGKNPVIFPITMQDITPFESGVHHVCGMGLPSVFCKAPVVGVPISMNQPVLPAAMHVQQPIALESAARYCLSVATSFGLGECEFYYESDWQGFLAAYGNIRGWQAR